MMSHAGNEMHNGLPIATHTEEPEKNRMRVAKEVIPRLQQTLACVAITFLKPEATHFSGVSTGNLLARQQSVWAYEQAPIAIKDDTCQDDLLRPEC